MFPKFDYVSGNIGKKVKASWEMFIWVWNENLQRIIIELIIRACERAD